MKRLPEPELMEEDAQARAYAEADFEEPHGRFIELLREAFPNLPRNGAALDLGCGPADVTLRFARAWPAWMVDGLDGSPAMLRYGRAAVARAGLGDRVRLIQCLLPADEAPRERYDLVFSNSLLHHLRDPGVLWESIKQWARADTPVFVMDLLRPESPEEARRLVAAYASQEPEILQHDFFHSLLAAYRVEEVEAQLATAGLGHLAVKPVGDRHLLARGRR